MKIPNQKARHIALYCSGLHNTSSVPCNKQNLIALVKYLGYVQLDPLQVVARAHDHILWSRNNNYRPRKLETLLNNDRLIFEHYCHDACVLPIETLPYWKNQFKRKAKLFPPHSNRNTLLNKTGQKRLLQRLADEGPLSSKDFKTPKTETKQAVWTKPAHKQTLDYLWLTGSLAVSKRVNFSKFYDLAERIYPQNLIDTNVDKQDRIGWLATHAFQRLGFATASEIHQFWDATSLDETKSWCERSRTELEAMSVESWSGESANALMLKSGNALLKLDLLPSKKLRIINPFDPIVRDRKRLKRLFGFDYRIEIYVPAQKRQYGYYVYPLLEYDKFVGRIEVRHDKSSNLLCVDNLWNEANVSFGKQRMQRLDSELERLRRFCGAQAVKWSE